MKAAFKKSIVPDDDSDDEDEIVSDDEYEDEGEHELQEVLRSDDCEQMESDEILQTTLQLMFEPDRTDEDVISLNNPLQSGCAAHLLQLTVHDGLKHLPVSTKIVIRVKVRH